MCSPETTALGIHAGPAQGSGLGLPETSSRPPVQGAWNVLSRSPPCSLQSGTSQPLPPRQEGSRPLLPNKATHSPRCV